MYFFKRSSSKEDQKLKALILQKRNLNQTDQTMRIILSILIFYRKLIVPSLAVALVLGFLVYLKTEKFPWTSVGIYYILMSLVFHYFIYEKRNPGDFYFYYNMGLSKFMLWAATLMLSLVIVLILIIVYLICR